MLAQQALRFLMAFVDDALHLGVDQVPGCLAEGLRGGKTLTRAAEELVYGSRTTVAENVVTPKAWPRGTMVTRCTGSAPRTTKPRIA